MASVVKHTKLVEKVITETVTEGYSLYLNQAEAQALTVILARIGGISENSPRAHTDSVLKALQANVEYADNDYSPWGYSHTPVPEWDRCVESVLIEGNLSFRPYPEEHHEEHSDQ